MHDVLPPYRLVLGPGVAIDPRVPQNCIRTGPPWCSTSSLALSIHSIHKAASLQNVPAIARIQYVRWFHA